MAAEPVPVAVAAIALVAALFTWWAWRRGAFFGPVFYPGAIGLLGLAAALLAWAPLRARLRGPGVVAGGALALLAAWTLLSVLWTPARDVAVEDGAKAAAYAVAFGVGFWVCNLLGRRMLWAAIPGAAAGAIVAIGTAVVLLTGDDVVAYLESDGTLRYPFGYRNAAAGFLLIAFWPIVALASSRATDRWLRAGLLGAAATALALAAMAQSRTAPFALLVGLAVFVAVSKGRVRSTAWPLLAGLAALPAAPFLLEVHDQGAGATAESLPPLRDAARASLGAGLLGALFGAAATGVEDRLSLRPDRAQAMGRAFGIAVAALAVAALIGGIAVTARDGGLIGFTSERLDELTSGGTPAFEERGSRYGLDLGSNRGDFWRVALDDAAEDPLLGTGAGGFQFSYLRERDTTNNTDDPHSVVLQMAGELGGVGLALFAAFIVAAAIAALRSRHLGPAAASLSAAALAAAAYWLVHAGVDWLWIYPAVTAPVIFLLGAAAAPAMLKPSTTGPPWKLRVGAIAGLAVLVAMALPFLLAERYTDTALSSWRADPAAAYDNLSRARQLNPFSDRAALAEAVIAEEQGEESRALEAVREAQRRKPAFWGAYYLEARILADSDPARATAALAEARERNPRSPEVERLAAELTQGR